jgi:hypothetical protein
LLEIPGTPVIADVDSDGQADLLVPSFAVDAPGLLTVLESDGAPWAPARRIWNQYAYHVNNVLEDGRIPAGSAETPAWPAHMRTNARVAGSALCAP